MRLLLPLLRRSTRCASSTVITHRHTHLIRRPLPILPHLMQQPQRGFSRKDKSKGGGGASGGSSSSTTGAHRTPAPHHQHAPSVGGAGSHNEELVVDLPKLQTKMNKCIEMLRKEFSGVRGGKPDAAMFDSINVFAYGKQTPLSEVGQVTIKSPTLALINVYDPDLLKPVNDAIKDSKLELNPRVEGNVVNVPLPKPSAETREGYVKLVREYTEKAKTNIRKVRREGLDKVKNVEGVGEDDVRRNSKLIEAMTEEVVKKAGEMLEVKKKEILTV